MIKMRSGKRIKAALLCRLKLLKYDTLILWIETAEQKSDLAKHHPREASRFTAGDVSIHTTTLVF